MEIHRNRLKDYVLGIIILSLAFVFVCLTSEACSLSYIAVYSSVLVISLISIDYFIAPVKISFSDGQLVFHFLKKRPYVCRTENILSIKYPNYFGPAQIRIYLRQGDMIDFILGSYTQDEMQHLVGAVKQYISDTSTSNK